jgi:tetratricopeptide (TPR) repeat protein
VTAEHGHVESNEATHALRVPDVRLRQLIVVCALLTRHQPQVDSVTRHLTDVTDSGQDALTRYCKDKKPQDLVSSIERFTRAVDLCPPDHACFQVVLFNLAVAQLIHCQVRGPSLDFDIEVPITLFRDVLDLRPAGHPDRPATLFHLAVSLLSRFHKQGDQTDASEARELSSQVMEYCPIESYYHRSAFITLEMSAIDRVVGPIATDNANDVVQSSDHDSSEADGMGDTALFHLGRFQELGQLVDLDRAISLFVQLTEDNHSNRLYWLPKLAMSYSIRFGRFDQLSDLTKSISTLDEILPLCPNDYARAGSLNNLGHLLRKRFERLGALDDIERSISALEDAVRLTPDDPHTDKPNMLGNLSASLRSRYERLGDLADIDKAISVAEDVLRRIPDYHPNTVRALSTLGASLQARFERLGDLTDLNRSIAVLENAIRIAPDGHPDKPTCLSHMGGSFLRRFERLGDLADIHASISVLEQSVRLTPDEPKKLGNLGYSLSVRFQRLGDVADIHRSILLLEDAMRRLPESDPSKLGYQSNLSRSLVDRFELLGDIKDIDEAVALFEDVARLTPKDHPENRAYLADCLRRRFHRLGDPADLKKAISSSEDALARTPKGHTGEAWAHSHLGGLLIDCFKQSGNVADINRAVSMQEQALRLVPDDHADKPAMLSNFCTALSMRFQFSGDLADIHKAISCYEDALRLLPEDHAYRPGFLHNLSNSFSLRFDHLGDKADVDKAISVLEEAVRGTPDEHPAKAFRLKALGSAFLVRFANSNDSSALPSARSHFSLAARSSASASSVRFQAAKWWIATNQLLENDALDAYGLTIGLLPQLAWIGLPLKDRHRALQQAAGIARDAAASAIVLHRTQTAVEWLEQGRSVVWAQLLQLRTSLDVLRGKYPALAERMLRVSKELELVSVRDPLLHLGRAGDLDTVSPERQARRHRTLAKELDDLLVEVRSSPGFERFLLPKTFTQLTAAAHSGPVVILNASKQRCDALIVTTGADDPLHVPLPDITFSEVVWLQTMLENLLENGGRFVSVPEPDRAARLASRRLNANDAFKRILSELWRKAVRPVLEMLGYLVG